MKEERMKVLEMLEKQVINADEAQRLLEMLTKPCRGERTKEAAFCFAEDFGDKAEEFSGKVQSAVKDFADNLESMAKNVEPRLRKATQIIIEKTVSTVDEVSKAFQEDYTKCNSNENKEECGCGCNEETKESEDDEPKEN